MEFERDGDDGGHRPARAGARSAASVDAREAPPRLDVDAPLFTVTAAAELAGMHAQTLRQYDRLGLVVPQRTGGNIRRYSLRNIDELREIGRLVTDGLNLEGIARVMALRAEVARLQRRVGALETELADERLARSNPRVFAADQSGGVVPVSRGRRAPRPTQLVVWEPRARR